MRRGIDGLSMVVQQSLEQAPCAESAFVLTQAQWNLLIADVDWQQLSAAPPAYFRS